MPTVIPGSSPDSALINTYANIPGGHTDCFYVDVSNKVTLTEFILVFFNTPVFRLERLLLSISPSGRSTRQDIADLASGSGKTMAIWKVESRTDTQLIMSVGNGPIRTWLMVDSDSRESGTSRLYFGTAVLPTKTARDGQPNQSKVFHMLAGFHEYYSRLLLWMAARQFER
ncbi:MAG: hypothetical protein JKY94_11125 [Rhodobacteraceae bacterium]|nr:hypothetical protein [Paracoccaceae bacterium]